MLTQKLGDLDKYVAWSNAHIGGDMQAEAVLSPGGSGNIADVKTRTSGWARFFRTSSYTNLRDETLAHFRRALTERYGERIADTAMRREAGGALTAASIARTVSFASIAAAKFALAPNGDRRFRLSDGDLTIGRATIDGMSGAGRAALRQYAAAVRFASRLLGSVPTGAAEAQDFSAGVRKAFKVLAQARVGLLQAFLADGDGSISETDVRRLADHCSQLVDRLDRHAAAMDERAAAGPISGAARTAFQDRWFEAFGQMCGRLAREVADPRAADALRDLALTDRRVFDEYVETNAKTAKYLAAIVEDALKRACSGRSPLSVGQLKERILGQYRELLNARAWNPIRKTFAGALAGQELTLTSVIVPGKHVAGVGEHYPAGVGGYMCHSAGERNHAVNLAVSSFSVGEVGCPAHTVFTGVRHGVHCAWEVENAEDRARANVARAQDAVRAAFSAYLEKHPGIKPGAEVELPMTSVSLLTPDVFRPLQAWFSGKNSGNEKMMLTEQTAAWQAVSDKPLAVTVNGRTYNVRPRIATFNFGVNGGGVGKLSFLTGGWGTSVAMNRAAMDVLRERAAAFVGDRTVRPELRTAAQRLFNQIAAILNDGAERSDGHDAYKAAARVAVLTSLMDGVPCWNCKSGKDRTGEMDVECKFLATLIDRRLPIPEPGEELTFEQKMLFRTIALQGGNHEMQEYNTGIAGFKTGGVQSIPERLGGSEARAVHKGAADFVAV